jgi:hypothetical protein
MHSRQPAEPALIEVEGMPTLPTYFFSVGRKSSAAEFMQ